MTKKYYAYIILIFVVMFSVISICGYAQTTENDLILEKSVTQSADDEGNYEITLEAYTTGEVGQQAMPLDVILVLDKSGTMNDSFKSGDGQEIKIESLKNSVNDFLLKLNENAKENNITHRVAIVTFSSTAQKVTGNDYVEIDGSSSVNDVISLVDEIQAGGGTIPNEGMRLAENIFDDNSEKDVNSQALIMFTDDCPDMTDYKTDYADKAIKIANRLKGQQVQIYSVGIFNKANPDMITFEDATETEGVYQKNVYVMGNRFLNYLSSNSPDATNLGMEFELKESTYYIKISEDYTWENKGYYMTADDVEGLYDIFYNLSQNLVTSSISLDANTQVRDDISEYFKLPEGSSVKDVTLKVIPYTGDETWGDPIEFEYSSITDNIAEYKSENTNYNLYVTYDADIGSVIVQGFDFDENIVAIDSAGNPMGNKLQIVFDITRQDDFIGGNDVPTNLSTSGVYSENNIVEKFEVPNTQVELMYEFDTEDQIIYRGNKVEVAKLLNIDPTHFGDANAFVDINFYIYDSENNEIGTVMIQSGTSDIVENLNDVLEIQDTDYTIKCIVTPNTAEDKSVAELEVIKKSFIYVLQPDVSVRDLWVDYGTTVDLQGHGVKDITWSGNAPEETYHSSKDNPPTIDIICDGSLMQDIVVESNQQCEINKLMITSSDGKTESQMDIDKTININLNEYGVEITKFVKKEEYNKNKQSFLFEINQNGNIIEVIMPEEAFEEYDDETLCCTMKVTGLYAGLDSVVSEITSWSWRYALDNCEEEMTVTNHNNPEISYAKVGVGETEASFKNKQMILNWLSDEQTVVNKFAEN